MSRSLELEVANFVCRFGSAVLLDYLEEIVLPAFFANVTRTYRETEYFFTEQDFCYLRENDIASLALRCRFVKNTTIRRHQIYSPHDGIIHDEQALESAPSAVAVLLLHTHRLLYVREVPNAPTMHVFGTTFAKFMREPVIAYRKSIYDQRAPNGETLTKKRISEDIPFPNVSVVPVVSSESLKEFLDRFATLNVLRLQVAPTNNEIDNEPFYKELRVRKKATGSNKTILQHQNPNGLDKKGCLAQLEDAKQGNVFVEMKGKDVSGDELRGNNDEFSVKAALGPISTNLTDRIVAAYDKYYELLAANVVAVGQPTHDHSDKLAASHRRLHGENSA